jgi:NAD(P)-dependent dehydrogenase (short-subunit alcohol dehydrogenase family)
MRKPTGRGKLAGKVALVTGGGGGIGGAICDLFGREGARVAVADLDLAAAKRCAGRIERAGGNAIPIEVDVSDPAQAARAVAEAVRAFKGLDILVNCAALRPSPVGTVVEQSFEEWRRTFAVNVTGPFLMCKHAIPHLKRGKGPSIINIASQLGQRGIARRAGYGASKTALIHFTAGLALDFAEDGIRANSISPGAVLTKQLAGNYGSAAAAEARLGPMHLFGRLGRPEEIAAGALFLASDDCPFMNGANLLLDGGYTMFKGVTRAKPKKVRLG